MTADELDLGPASDLDQSDDQDDDGSDEQDRRLENRGEQDRLHASEDRVQAREEHEPDGADPEHVVIASEDPDAVDAEDRPEDHPSGIDGHGDLGQHVADQGNDGQDGPGGGIEAPFQVLGHGEDLDAIIERDEDPAEDEDEPGLDFPVGHGHPADETGPGQADKVFGPDIGGEDRRADRNPAGVAAGQEIVRIRLLLFADGVQNDSDHRDGEKAEDDPVQPMKCGAHSGLLEERISMSSRSVPAGDRTDGRRPSL